MAKKVVKKGRVLSPKELYWARRKAKMRGQTSPGKHGFIHRGEDPTDRRLTKKALLNNTRRARKLAIKLDAEGEISI